MQESIYGCNSSHSTLVSPAQLSQPSSWHWRWCHWRSPPMAARRFVLPGVPGRDTVPGVPARRADHASLLQRDQVIGSGGADDAWPPHRVRVHRDGHRGAVGDRLRPCRPTARPVWRLLTLQDQPQRRLQVEGTRPPLCVGLVGSRPPLYMHTQWYRTALRGTRDPRGWYTMNVSESCCRSVGA